MPTITTVGRRRERLTIQQDSSTGQTVDGRTQSWSSVATVWAEMIPGPASEQTQGVSVGAQTDYRFRVNQRTDVRVPMQVLWTPSWGGSQQTLQIQGVQPEGDGRRYMVVSCSRWGNS